MYQTSSCLEQKDRRCEDALFVIEKRDSVWFCISDGAGGMAGGAAASAYVIEAFRKLTDIAGFSDPMDFESFLRKLDLELSKEFECGEATAIVGKIAEGMITGASVGDSEAWVFSHEYEYQLTSLQNIKPLLGSGCSMPVGFGPANFEMSLLVGSDGLFKYAKYGEIKGLLHGSPAAKDIAALAKEETGELQDDISIILINKK